MCKCLCDFVVHNQHWQHSCKDLHIFHFDKLELLGILDQSNTHKVCILCKDFLCAQVDIGTLQNDCLLCKMLWYHTSQRDMDLGTPFEYKPVLKDIHHPFCNQLNIQKYNTNQNLTYMRNSYFNLTLFAYPVWISFITRTANTKGSMSGNTAFSINSTRASGARVQAFFSDTCKMIGAFWISSAFWSGCCGQNISCKNIKKIVGTSSH